MHTDPLRFIFGPAALPLAVIVALRFLYFIQRGYYVSKRGNTIYRDKNPRTFWLSMTIGAFFVGALVFSAISYFVVDKTIFEYSDKYGYSHGYSHTSKSQENREEHGTGKKQELQTYVP